MSSDAEGATGDGQQRLAQLSVPTTPPMHLSLLLAATQTSVPRRLPAGSNELETIGDAFSVIVIVGVVLVLAVIVAVAVSNWRAGSKLRQARKLARTMENRDRRPLMGEDRIRSARRR